MRHICHHTAILVRFGGCIFVVTLFLLYAARVQAAIVDPSVTPVESGPGLVSMSYNNTFNNVPYNDNVAGSSANLLEINQKAFGPTGFIDYIDIVFTVLDDGSGTTEYELREGIDNGTGTDWTDYHVELGFGTGAGFVRSTPGDGLDFDSPDFDSLYDFGPFPFGSLTITADTIDAVGGIFPNGSFMNFRFPVDVPDGITTFTLRQLPTIDFLGHGVPEPGTLSLAMLGILALAVATWRRRSGRYSWH